MVMGYVPIELAIAGTAFEVEINGENYAAKIIDQPLYDPQGLKMRG
jgi:glycine cleavage system aminomethyltransferase T